MLKKQTNEVTSWISLIVLFGMPILALVNWRGKPRTGRWIEALTNAATGVTSSLHWHKPAEWASHMHRFPPQSHPVSWYFLYTYAFWFALCFVIGYPIYRFAEVMDKMAGTNKSTTTPPASSSNILSDQTFIPAPQISYGGITSFWTLLLGGRDANENDYQAAVSAGRLSVRMGLMVVGVSVIPMIVALAIHNLWYIGVFGFFLIVFGLLTLASGMTTSSTASAYRHAMTEQGRLIEVKRTVSSWPDQQEAVMQILRDDALKVRQLLAQPHQLRMKAMDLPAIMLQLKMIAANDPKFESIRTLINDADEATQRIIQDANDSGADKDAAAARAAYGAELIAKALQRMIDKGL